MAWAITAVLAVIVIGLIAQLVRQRSSLGTTARLESDAAEAAAAAIARADTDKKAAQAQAAEAATGLGAAQARVAELEAGLATATGDRDAAHAQMTTLQAELATATEDRDAAQREAATWRAELDRAGQAHEAAQTELTTLRSELDRAEAGATAREREIQTTRAARRAAEARVTILETEIQAARSARTAAEAKVASLHLELETAKNAASEADARVDPSVERAEPRRGQTGRPGRRDGPNPPEDGTPGDARLAAVWALAELAQRRAWRLSLASPGEARADGLDGALTMEVERIREEVGTPGSLSTSLEPAVAADDATLALLGARELLATLAPHTQAYDMTVRRDGDQLTITVVCTGWDGPTDAADDVGRLLAAVAPTGADLQLDADAAGRLQATLQLPLLG